MRKSSTASDLYEETPSEEDLKLLYKIFNFQNKVKDLREKLKEIRDCKNTTIEVEQSIKELNASIKS